MVPGGRAPPLAVLSDLEKATAGCGKALTMSRAMTEAEGEEVALAVQGSRLGRGSKAILNGYEMVRVGVAGAAVSSLSSTARLLLAFARTANSAASRAKRSSASCSASFRSISRFRSPPAAARALPCVAPPPSRPCELHLLLGRLLCLLCVREPQQCELALLPARTWRSCVCVLQLL